MASPDMSLPIAKLSGPLASCHSGACIMLAMRTVAGFMFGTSMPTSFLPGIGASMRIE